jgi:hypothetical protein
MTAGPGFKIQISTGPYPARAVLLALAGETISKSIFVAAHELDDVIVALVEARRRVIERWGAAALRREHEGPWGTWAPSKRATDVTLVAGVVDTPDAEVER